MADVFTSDLFIVFGWGGGTVTENAERKLGGKAEAMPHAESEANLKPILGGNEPKRSQSFLGIGIRASALVRGS
jgi:hypothetical protein